MVPLRFSGENGLHTKRVRKAYRAAQTMTDATALRRFHKHSGTTREAKRRAKLEARRMPPTRLDSISRLNPGEGAVINVAGQSIQVCVGRNDKFSRENLNDSRVIFVNLPRSISDPPKHFILTQAELEVATGSRYQPRDWSISGNES